MNAIYLEMKGLALQLAPYLLIAGLLWALVTQNERIMDSALLRVTSEQSEQLAAIERIEQHLARGVAIPAVGFRGTND
jgi:hypothetical protein